MHAARVLSLANGVAGVLTAAVLSLHAIGQAYARLAEITPKSGVKQIDRLVGNDGIRLDKVMALWSRHVVGDAAEIRPVFGMGLKATHIKSPARRDRLLLMVAIAHTLLCLLGAANEESGLDKYLKINTSKKRTHSLYRQGLYWYSYIPTMREEWLSRLMAAFDRIVREHSFFSQFFGMK